MTPEAVERLRLGLSSGEKRKRGRENKEDEEEEVVKSASEEKKKNSQRVQGILLLRCGQISRVPQLHCSIFGGGEKDTLVFSEGDNTH